MPGPMPSRRGELLGHRSKDHLEGKDITKLKGGMGAFKMPELPETWHPTCLMIWNSAANSPLYQQLYQPTDWAMLYTHLEDLNEFKSKRGSGLLAQVCYSGLSSLLLTEGERRRAKIEILNDGPPVDEDALAMDIYSNIAG